MAAGAAEWAALRERDLSLKLNSLGIAVSLPVAIWELSSIVGPDNKLIPSNQVIDLDGTLARPSLFVYQSRQRWRLADLPHVQPSVRVHIKNCVKIGKSRRSCMNLPLINKSSVIIVSTNYIIG